jgi:hypothetical protein
MSVIANRHRLVLDARNGPQIGGQDTAEWFLARLSRNWQPTDLNKSP